MQGHGGHLAVAVAQAHGVSTLFTLSGAHVFPLYDAAVTADPPMPIVDVRHEQTAVFAAEATAKLTRAPGLAVLTAGPGVTNGVSAITSAWFNGSPVLVLGGRAPTYRWGSGALQELDHPPLLAPVTKDAATVATTEAIPAAVDEALRLATRAHRGPVFLDVGMDQLFSRAEVRLPAPAQRVRQAPDDDDLERVGALLAEAHHPVLVLGSDVWSDGAEHPARRLVETTGVPVVANGMGRGVLPAGHPLLVTRARSTAFDEADLVVVVGAPLDFRLGYGRFGGRDGRDPARVVHLVDSPGQVATHVGLAGSAAGDLTAVIDGVLQAWARQPHQADLSGWVPSLAERCAAAQAADAVDLASASDPIHPARVYGELRTRLAEDAVVAGDGGDFVSFAGRYLTPARPGGWLDPGPYGCLGTGLGYAIAARLARPSAQVLLLLGDGAAGFSLMDVDTLVRHGLPVVMVLANNGCWGLEKHPMRQLYGYDVAAELSQSTRYDQVVQALGGAGETVSDPEQIGPALDRAFAAEVPYLVNVITDPGVAYPRSTTGI
ncbi:MAG: acetolactate synthase [Actinomycetes bacterium]